MFGLKKQIQEKSSKAGPGFTILNVMRAINIISLMLVLAASSIMIVKTFIVSKFFFFDAISHVITGLLSIFLMITEVSLFKKYFLRNWPLLSLKSGFVTLGVFMIIVGVSILGNLNKDATSQQSLGLSFWQIVICSGILTTIMGVANVVVSYIFRVPSQGVTARMVREYGATAHLEVHNIVGYGGSPPSRTREFMLGRSDSLPSYQTSPKSQMADVERGDSHAYKPHVMPSRSSSYASASRHGLNISAPVNVDHDQFSKFKGQTEEIRKPDIACHPALQGGRF